MILIALGLIALVILAWLAYQKFTKTLNTFTSPWQRLQNLFN